jgi:tetratricopeptide (TPR) repeat protein
MFSVLLLCAAVSTATGQTRPEISFKLAPGGNLPLGPNAAWFGFGGSAEFSAGLHGLIPFVSPQLSIGYDYVPLRTTDAVHIVRAGAGAAVPLQLSEAITLAPYLLGGYSYGVISDGSGQGGGPFLKGGVQFAYALSSLFNLGADLSYRWDFGSWSGVGLSVHSGVRFPIGRQQAAPPPRLIKGLELLSWDPQTVFPALFKLYDTTAFGTATIRNLEQQPLTDLAIDVFAASYMDNPTRVLSAARLDAGADLKVPLKMVFSEKKILDITQDTRGSARMTVSFVFMGQPYTREFTPTLVLYNRNNIVWDDTRKAAVFVTPNDPLVLALSKNAVAAAADLNSGLVDPKLCAAMAIHEALRVKGQRYSADPKTPFDQISKNAAAIDTIFFPQEALAQGAGDCDDLTILFCALLQSVGAQTAFITTPGHIFAAVKLDLDAGQTASSFSRGQDLIVREGAVWLPLEVTMVGGRFMDAWQTGAKEWRESSANGKAELLPVSDSWAVYKPVGQIPPLATMVTLPDRAAIAAAFAAELRRFVDQEIAPRVSALSKEIAARKTDPRPLNVLGVLYAKFGRVDQAAIQFEAAAKLGDYVPALINLGNIRFAAQDYRNALALYQRARSRDPQNGIAILGLARAYASLGNDSDARTAFEALRKISPDLANRFAYLAEPASDSARAASREPAMKSLVWAEGEK